MDPNSWSDNFNQQYRQLNDGANLSQHPVVLGHHELSALNQTGLATAGKFILDGCMDTWTTL